MARRSNPNHIVLIDRDGRGTVTVDGVRLDPARSLKLRNHSPDGFSWGYYGSGPAQLALAILLHVTDDEEASLELYQQFKDEFVGGWPQANYEDWIDVSAWVQHRSGSRQGIDQHGIDRDFPKLYEMAQQHDFADRFGALPSELHQEVDKALREIWMGRNEKATAE